MQLHIGVAGS